MELSELIAHYADAWSQPDRARRQQLLESVWDEQGTYADPFGLVAGRMALVDHMGAFIQQYPGSRLERTSEIDAHDQSASLATGDHVPALRLHLGHALTSRPSHPERHAVGVSGSHDVGR